ncbi:MAG: hypothetical protein ABL999_06640 [Pyrinomonadaceae bacterium]
MTYSEALTTLRRLNRKDKIRAIQFLANEVAMEEEVYFEEGRTYEIFSPHESFEAAGQLRELLEESERVNVQV